LPLVLATNEEFDMNQNEIKCERIKMEKAVELLFNDSSKNFSELKSRQWTAASLSVAAIVAIAVFDHKESSHHRGLATVVMFVVTLCHLGVTRRCSTNLEVFRVRIRELIGSCFPNESHRLFKKKEFADALVDEGSIEFILYFTTPITLLLGCYIVWCLG
jgi:hypothetical protein